MSRTFGPCEKCESSEVRVDYHDGQPHCAECKKLGITPPPSCKYSDPCGEDGIPHEHLVVRCQRCHVGWIEETSGIAAALPATDSREEADRG